ncbi:MAG: GNAT family N-acetyltransferase [Ruminococcaceae bacterium]|nr:GNAT family N-acetyltransferase [Oscillospiraceae bacterium]
MNLLYSYSAKQQNRESVHPCEFEIKTISPGLGKWNIPKEQKSKKDLLVRIMFSVLTGGKTTIVYAVDKDGSVMHTSYVVPRCMKFPFLRKGDLEIGPCATLPEYRGRGIYPAVLRHICKTFANEDTVFYMIVNDQNIPSIRGIEKAGFELCGTVKRSRFLKIYNRQ